MQLTLPFIDKDTPVRAMTEDDLVSALEPSLAPTYTNARQAAIISRLMNKLVRNLDASQCVRTRSPVDLGPFIVPDPSLVICSTRDDHYVSSHPEPKDVHLVIEVIGNLDTYDQQRFDLYQDYGVTTVWAVDVEHQLVVIQDNRLIVNTILDGTDVLTVPESRVSITVAELFA